jgi:hypothetical protein
MTKRNVMYGIYNIGTKWVYMNEVNSNDSMECITSNGKVMRYECIALGYIYEW